jgi:hypothetical protein
MTIYSRTQKEALESFRANAERLSDPDEQSSIEAEAGRQIREGLEGFEIFLARSSVLGHDEFIR